MWPVVWITVVVGNSNPSLCIFAMWWVAGWQRPIGRPPPPWRRRPRRRWRTPQRQRQRWQCLWQPLRGSRNKHSREQRCQLLPGTVWQNNDSVCGGSDGVVNNGGRDDFYGRPQRWPWENGRIGGGDVGVWGNICTLPPEAVRVEFISDTVWGGETGEVDEVPDGLFYAFWSSDLSEHSRPGPMTQLLSTTWSWCVWVFASLSDQSYYLCRWICLPLCLLWRQTRTQFTMIEYRLV